ncbi:phage portal protein [Enterococcus sp. BWM-S5]|uniref:Phage portal protein n=1 Tax=Enterococcus larvae TaxID=2794352 RepID=A0ABS4CE36_9ENTE|nr:phage portal protein [Enterococcus larvae]MBP1044853.1 phage portal protein [Enterococcus larvae]
MIVDRLFPKTEQRKDTRSEAQLQTGGFNFLTELFGSKRKTVRVDNADTFDDIYTCVNILSDDVAKLPVKLYRKDDEKIVRIRKKDNKLAKLLTGRPNEYMNISDYFKLLMVDVLLDGNHYSLMKFDKDGEVEALLPLPNSTQPVKDQLTGALYYQTTIENKNRLLHPWEVIHVKGFSRDGIIGKSPIRVIAERVQSNELANDYNKNLLEHGGTPKGILKVPGMLAADAKQKAKDEWKRVNGSDAIAVIDSGLEYQQLGITNEDMQFIDSQKFNTQKIAAIYKVPLHKINEMGRATYSNSEIQSLEYVKNALQPWITRIEIEFNTKIFTEKEQEEEHYIKFNLDSELRGDSKTRAEVHKIQAETGAKTLDDIRAENESSPYDAEWSKTPFITLNWTQADNLVRYQNAKAGVDKMFEAMKGGELENENKNGDEGDQTNNNDN